MAERRKPDPAHSAEASWRHELRSVAFGGREGLSLLGVTFWRWMSHNDPGQAAALAYYAMFAMAPVLIIAITVAGLAFGREIAEGQMMYQIEGLVGPAGAKAIHGMLVSAFRPAASIPATALGIAALLFGATGVFAQLQYGLNQVWEVKLKPGLSWMNILVQRFKFVLMMVGIGFLLLVTLVVSAVLNAIGKYFGSSLIGPMYIWQLVNLAASLAIVTVLFALIFKLLPDVLIAWGDVWIGALATALLFTLGKSLIGLYLGHASVGSAYGAAGSLVIVLIWVYYSAQLVFLGAEFTAVWALRHGSLVKPANTARPAQVPPRKDAA